MMNIYNFISDEVHKSNAKGSGVHMRGKRV